MQPFYDSMIPSLMVDDIKDDAAHHQLSSDESTMIEKPKRVLSTRAGAKASKYLKIKQSNSKVSARHVNLKNKRHSDDKLVSHASLKTTSALNLVKPTSNLIKKKI